MKKLFLVMATSFALAACGGDSTRSEANREDDENYETDEPAVSDDEDEMDDNTTTDTSTVLRDTAATRPGNTPSR
jgi:hypothetical protein